MHPECASGISTSPGFELTFAPQMATIPYSRPPQPTALEAPLQEGALAQGLQHLRPWAAQPSQQVISPHMLGQRGGSCSSQQQPQQQECWTDSELGGDLLLDIPLHDH